MALCIGVAPKEKTRPYAAVTELGEIRMVTPGEARVSVYIERGRLLTIASETYFFRT